MKYDEVVYNEKEDSFIYKTKLSNNQIFEMTFECLGTNKRNEAYWNVDMCCYSKRKEKAYSDCGRGETKSTGKNPMETIGVALKAFNLLEKRVSYEPGAHIILVFWTDKRRRDIYARYLTKHGFKFDNYDGYKCLMKRLEKNNG